MKKVTGQIKLQLPAGKANPAPPVGAALGPHGVHITRLLCRVYSGRSFTFVMKTPPASVLLKKAAGLSTGKKPGAGSKEPNKNKVGKVTEAQVRDLANQKMGDMNCTDVESAIRTIKG